MNGKPYTESERERTAWEAAIRDRARFGADA